MQTTFLFFDVSVDPGVKERRDRFMDTRAILLRLIHEKIYHSDEDHVGIAVLEESLADAWRDLAQRGEVEIQTEPESTVIRRPRTLLLTDGLATPQLHIG